MEGGVRFGASREPQPESPVAEDERRLPLFPLNTVLFPGMPLPLHIFEERYKLMIGTCLVTDRTFGVSLIREGHEVGEPADPFAVGTFARILDVERLPDGRMNLVAVGVRRYRLLHVLEERPFLVGRVRALPDADERVEPALAASVAEGFRAYVRDLPGGEGVIDRLELSDDPEALSFQIAASLQIPAPRRQDLLELESTAERLGRLEAIIRREHETYRLLGRADPGKNAGPFSLN
jgi:Lon protease-like protein